MSSKSKHIDLICSIGAMIMVVVTIVVMCGGGTFIKAAELEMPYVNKLFSTDKVHRIEIVANENDWQSMLDNAAAEEYISCTAVIDGEKYTNVAIRPKGNSSLSTVASSDSDRYSFKIEFDHYDSNLSYHGLDKLCLNNAIQDNTYMKDYICYQMMNYLGADAPLSSFAWITVNGSDWGLYTAVEGVEDSFAQRKYGANHGQIYKPDSMDMGGGGRGAEKKAPTEKQENDVPEMGDFPSSMDEIPDMPDNFMQPPDMPVEGERPEMPNSDDAAKGGEVPEMPGMNGDEAENKPAEDFAGKGFGRFGAMGGSDDVLLVYSDDDPNSYSNIFDNAVFNDVTAEDKARLIASVKALNEGSVEDVVNIDEVLRYFAVHNFVLNEDSYTGSITHNYYLNEQDGVLSMIAWDYNLAFGGMSMTGAGGATSYVNSPIDSPVTSGDIADRPMISWIFESEEYTEQYHSVMDELIGKFFESGEFESMIDSAVQLISPYVEKDPTAFCSYEEFEKGVQTLKEFCLRRAESVRGQLDGSIPSTSEGQSADKSGFVDASDLNVSDMGTQSTGMDKAPMFDRDSAADKPEKDDGDEADEKPNDFKDKFSGGMNIPVENEISGVKEAATDDMQTWLLLGCSIVILMAGIVFAKLYR